MHVFWNFIKLGMRLCPLPRPYPHHFSKFNFISKISNFTMQINAYQEGTKINTEVNERPLKNIGMHWSIRHCWFQRVPISFSLARKCPQDSTCIPISHFHFVDISHYIFRILPMKSRYCTFGWFSTKQYSHTFTRCSKQKRFVTFFFGHLQSPMLIRSLVTHSNYSNYFTAT